MYSFKSMYILSERCVCIHSYCTLCVFLLQVYSCYDMLLDGTSIGEYLLSEEMKVGSEVVSVPSNEASWPSEWHPDHTTLLSMLNPQEKDSE